MIDLKKYNSPIHKVTFEEGDLYLKKLPADKVYQFDSLEDRGERMLKTVLCSLCDESGDKLDLTLEDVKKMDADIVSTIFLECQIINKPKKKIDSVQGI